MADGLNVLLGRLRQNSDTLSVELEEEFYSLLTDDDGSIF